MADFKCLEFRQKDGCKLAATKFFSVAICVLMLSVMSLLSGCSLFHQHEWLAATCTSPEVCASCGETKEGSTTIEHTWVDATCEQPKTCSACQATQGEALGHTWEDATCELPRTCSVCHATDGAAIGHAWVEANCQHPTYCSVCEFKPDDKLGGHVVTTWDEVVDSTCSEIGYQTGKCSVCATECTEEIALKDHTLNEWTVISTPVYGVPGVSEQPCSVCGQVINTKEVSYSEYIANRYTLTGETRGFEITDCEVWYVQDGTYSGDYIDGVAVVEVVNTGETNLFLKECFFEFEDDYGQFLGTGGIVDMVVAVPSVIAPGETGYFIRKIVCPMEELDTSNGLRVKVRIDIRQTTKEAVYYDVEYRSAGFDIAGTVHNTTSEASNRWTLVALYKNDRGQVIQFSSEFFVGETLGADEYRTISLTPLDIDPIIANQITSTDVVAWNYEDEP